MQAAIDPDTVTSVTGTAFVVAEYRAEENYAVHPLYRDDVVGLFLSAASRRAAAQAAAGFPLVKELVKIRTRYFDDMLERQIADGCRQVVLLGAGLDTRAVRKAAAGVRFFEIDDAATMSLKRYVLDQHRLERQRRLHRRQLRDRRHAVAARRARLRHRRCRRS